MLDREEERKVLSERIRKDIGELLWKACGYLLEGDAELYREVSEEVEPAIKLSREIIEELQNNNKELQENIRELQHDMENGCQRLLAALREEGKSREEAKALLMAVFALSEKSAGEKMRIYWKDE